MNSALEHHRALYPVLSDKLFNTKGAPTKQSNTLVPGEQQCMGSAVEQLPGGLLNKINYQYLVEGLGKDFC